MRRQGQRWLSILYARQGIVRKASSVTLNKNNNKVLRSLALVAL